MMRRERLSTASRQLVPMRQGNLDGLCGLYATINAVQLALYPNRLLKRAELVQLFDAGLQVLRKARALSTVMIHGMHGPLWAKVSAAVVAKAAVLKGCQLKLSCISLSASADEFTMIRQVRHNVSRGRPVLLCVEGRLNHWTVVSRFSKTRLTLFDSSNHSWLLVRSICLAGTGVLRPYVVPRHGLVALHLEDS
ncbi:MAG TPA: hypothetical protein VF637_13975 [Sphingomicrobium sp.]|jgi:hypothetical protein